MADNDLGKDGMERQELLRLIDEAAADQRKVLNLSSKGLTEIPEAIGKLQNLTNLNNTLDRFTTTALKPAFYRG